MPQKMVQGFGLANHHGLSSIVVMLEVVSNEIRPLRAQVDRCGEQFLLYTLEALRSFFFFDGFYIFSHTYSPHTRT
ncbi:hypothetical protein ES703_104553 [subsurface metagenome]